MSSPFYTNVSIQKNKVVHRFVDKHGNRQIEAVPHQFNLFIKAKETDEPDSFSLYGDPLKCKVFDSNREMREYVKEYNDLFDIYGMQDAYIQFIADTYPEEEIVFDMQYIRIANIDIETEIGKGFPKPQEAAQQVNSITVRMIGSQNSITFTTLDYRPELDTMKDDCSEVIVCRDEVELFKKFLNLWQYLSPDAATGWNTNRFDFPFLINRGLKIVPDDIYKLSPIYKHVYGSPFRDVSRFEGKPEGSIYEIAGLDLLDYHDLYKKFNYDTLPDYKLETVAQHELGKGKLDYCGFDSLKEFYLGNPTMFVRYNIRDVALINELDEKLKYLYLVYTVAYQGHVNPTHIFGEVKYWDCVVYNELKRAGIQIPPNRTKQKQPFVGAFVNDVIVGKSRWVVAFDLTSLYPMVIKQYNISPETLRHPSQMREGLIDELVACKPDIPELLEAKRLGYAMTANGAMFDKSCLGWFPKIIQKFFDKRVAYKKEMKKWQKELERLLQQPTKDNAAINHAISQIAVYDARQMAVKIAINSLN